MRKGLLVLGLLLGLMLGVGSAGGHVFATHTVTVQVYGKGRVNSSDSKIKCGNGEDNCYLSFAGGETITLTHSAPSGWSFVDWDLDGLPCGDPCSVDTTAADHLVEATFTRASGSSTSTLSVTTSGSGEVSAPETAPTGTEIACGTAGNDCSWDVLTGSTLTLFETPASGSVFAGWSSSCSGTSAACTIEMDSNKAVGATWTDAGTTTQLTITVKGSGRVKGSGINCPGPGSCSVNEPLNAVVTLEATPGDGYAFTGWSGGGCEGTGGTCTITMDAARAVTATFSPLLTVAVTGNGTVSAGSGAINCGNGATICSAPFPQGQPVTLIATAATGSTFTGWGGACSGSATTCIVLMSSAKDVSATFTGGTGGTGFTLSVSVSGNGTVTGGGINCGSGATTCSVANRPAGSAVTLTATPTGGATFGGWGGACSGTAATCTVIMNSAQSVTATFVGGTASFQLSVSVSGSGTVTGGGINCGNGAPTCSVSQPGNTTVTLTATAAAGATFTGWGGACSGTAKTCAVSMTSAKTVSATFTTSAGPPGTLTITVSGKGKVSTTAGSCAATGPQKTCVQKFAAGKKVTLTATPATGATFTGWSGSCAGTKVTCTVILSVARSVTARFSGATTPPPTGGNAVLRSLGPPVVKRAAGGFNVTLRFTTTVGGVAHVRGLRAGRVAASVSLRVAAGRATIGPFPVAKTGLYTFEVRLAGRRIQWRACVGSCGASAPGPNFVLTREAPVVTRSGDVWSVTLRLRANLISSARVVAYRGQRLLVDQRFLGRVGRISVGPFLLGPGSYTLKVTAIDAYGRTRTLTWIVALAR